MALMLVESENISKIRKMLFFCCCFLKSLIIHDIASVFCKTCGSYTGFKTFVLVVDLTVVCLCDRSMSLLTLISLVSFLWDIDKQNIPRCDAAKCGVPSGAILFAYLIFIEKWNKNEKHLLMPLKLKWTHPNDKDGKVHPSQVG